jgi:hypothetical protein
MKKFKIITMLFILILSIAAPGFVKPSAAEAAVSEISLKDLGYTNVTSSYRVEYNGFSGKPFQDSQGNSFAEGLGIEGGYNVFEIDYNIANYGFDTFSANIGLQSYLGDYGRSAVHIYADNEQIYKKEFLFSTKTDQMELKLPKDTNNIKIMITSVKGAKGYNDVFFGEAKFKSAGNAAPAVDTTYKLSDIGAVYETSSYYTAYDNIEGNSFIGSDNQFYGRGLGIEGGYTNFDVKYNIKNYNIKSFEGILGVQQQDGGDYGETSVSFFADNELVYQAQLKGTEKPQNFKVDIPEGTENLLIRTGAIKGAKGFHNVFIANDSLVVNDGNVRPGKDLLFLQDIGVLKSTSSYYYGFNRVDGDAAVDMAGKFHPAVIGIEGGHSTYELTFNTTNYPYQVFQSYVALQNQAGDRGDVTFFLYADSKKLAERKLNSKNNISQIGAVIPKGTKELRLITVSNKGANGYYDVFWSNAHLSNGFTDVLSNFWAYNEIGYLKEKSVIGGYPDGTFRPNNNLTRSQAASMVARALKLDTRNAADPKLLDVKKGENAYDAIAAVMAKGLFDDFVGKEFKPNQFLTRGEMSSILVRAFELSGDKSKTFKDTGSHWAKEHISLLAAHNITTGYTDNTFKPNANLTRGQFSVFFARAMHDSFRTE